MSRGSVRHGQTRGLAFLLLWLGASSWPAARADTGVSDGRVSLPDGPGSLGGAGEQLSATGNMGAMAYTVPLELPRGFAGATPSLALSYNSLQGSGEVGLGWELAVPHIERLTVRGLPRYDESDGFAVDGAEEIVRVSSKGSEKVYRARFEGAFVRYTWHADARGAAGYWEAEYPDGRRGFFGADASGQIVPSARVMGRDGGVFRYLLVETLDRFDHRVRYHYTEEWGDYPLLSEIAYVFLGDVPRYQVRLSYERRPDPLSSALSGEELRLTGRLAAVSVLSSEVVLRRYALRYAATTAGLSQLRSIEEYGSDGGLSPVRYAFSYSGAARPVAFGMGTLQAGASGGVDLKRGLSTLIDIDGDALPDLLDTGAEGLHRFFLNTLAPDGSQRFGAPKASARTRKGSGFTLDAPGVQAVDLNGDGLTDLIDAASGRQLCNLGEGDWSEGDSCGRLSLAAQLTDDPTETGEADPRGMRFLDYDGDRRIDLLHTVAPDMTQVFRNTPDGFVSEAVEPLGKVFDDASTLQLGDMNGDGLLDPVEVSASGLVWYRLNLGRGHWGKPMSQQLEFAPSALEDAQLQDLNADGLDDVVVVRANTVQFALNQSGRFLPFEALRSSDVAGGLPTVTASTTVLFADMNGSGSTDVVWVGAGGEVQVLEWVGQRPNLLTRIDNGVGGVETASYGSSAREQARDRAAGLAWRRLLPQAMTVVTAVERFASLAKDVRSRSEYRYHHGFYDGRERRYRGFAQVEERVVGDATQETGVTVFDYDVGDADPSFQGKLLREQVGSGEGESLRPLRVVRHAYAECPLADVPRSTGARPVRHVCEQATETLLQEGRPERAWVKLRTEREIDGFGQLVRVTEHGVVGLGRDGKGACGKCDAPEGTSSGACGPRCLGDERVVETEWVKPGPLTGQAWLLGRPSRVVGYGDPRGPRTETLYFYDGTEAGRPFEGLPLGQATRGLVTRTCERATPEAAAGCAGPGWVQSGRAEHDAHGNVVTELDPLGAPDDLGGHRRAVSYDAHGLRVTALEVFLTSADGPYRLRREFGYDARCPGPTWATRWMLQGKGAQSERGETRFDCDAFGRPSRVARPGDTLAAPTSEFTYELSAPLSRIIARTRSKASAPPDLEQITCVDGLGRALQRRTRVDGQAYQADGFVSFNAQGLPGRTFEGYLGSAQCDVAPPGGVPFRARSYDGLGRVRSVTEPDASLYGAASRSRVEYGPLETLMFDAEDDDPTSPHHGTPQRSVTDGLFRLVAVERALDPSAEPSSVRALWDSLGRLAGYLDAEGHEKRETYDLLGRVLSVDDPNAGRSEYGYDLGSNLIAYTDARGQSVHTTYDGLNRPLVSFNPADPKATHVERAYDVATGCEGCTYAESKLVAIRYALGKGRGDGVDTFGFDVRDQPVRFTRTLEGHAFQQITRFDNAGRPVATVYPDGTTLTQRYDLASRVQSVDGVLDSVSYDARGRVAGLGYANGVRTTYAYDAGQRLSDSTTRGPDGQVMQGFGYRRDRVGNVLAMVEEAEGPSGASRRDLTFRYDAWYRATRADLGDEVVDLRFDALDNITRKVSSLGPRSFDHAGEYQRDATRPNAVAQAGELDLHYDAAGQLIRRGGAQLSWDYLGRLQRVESAEGHVAEYLYGPGVERVMELEDGGVTYHIGPDFEVRDGIAVTYARLGRQRVARSSSAKLAATVLEDYDASGRIDASDAWLAVKSGSSPRGHLRASARRLLLEASWGPVFLHSDHLGSLTLSTSGSGRVVGQRAYSLSGAVRRESGFVDVHGFTGGRLDPSLGLIHFAYRALDPTLSRWIKPDPLYLQVSEAMLHDVGQATTAYAYVANRFINAADPTGLQGGLKTGPRPEGPAKSVRFAADANLSQRREIPYRHYDTASAAYNRVRRYVRTHATREELIEGTVISASRIAATAEEAGSPALGQLRRFLVSPRKLEFATQSNGFIRLTSTDLLASARRPGWFASRGRQAFKMALAETMRNRTYASLGEVEVVQLLDDVASDDGEGEADILYEGVAPGDSRPSCCIQ